MGKRHKKNTPRDHSDVVQYHSERKKFKYGDNSYTESAAGSSDNDCRSTNKRSIALFHSSFSPAKHVADMPIYHPRQQPGQYGTYGSRYNDADKKANRNVPIEEQQRSYMPSSHKTMHHESADILCSPRRYRSRTRSRSPMKFQSPDNVNHIRTVRTRSCSSKSSISRSSSPELSCHQRSPSPELTNLLQKYSDLTQKKEVGVAGVLKSVIASVLSAPDVKSIISAIPAGENRDELLKKLIEDQLSQSLARNPALLKEMSVESCGAVLSQKKTTDQLCEFRNNDNQDASPTESLPSAVVEPQANLKFVPLMSLPEQPKLSLLESYVKNLFSKNNIKYCDESGTPEKNVTLLIDYQAKYFVSDAQQRILPCLKRKVIVNHDLHCKNCKQEFSSSDERSSHDKSYLHLMITGDWWTNHAPPPKYLPMYINNVRCEKIFIWCIVCFEKHGISNNEQLFQHLKSSHHQFNMHCWKECYDVLPLHEWCLWRDVASEKNSLPTSTVNGFDWPKHMESCIMADQ